MTIGDQTEGLHCCFCMSPRLKAAAISLRVRMPSPFCGRQWQKWKGRSELSKSYFNIPLPYPQSPHISPYLPISPHISPICTFASFALMITDDHWWCIWMAWPDRSHGTVRAQRVLGPVQTVQSMQSMHGLTVHAQFCFQVYKVGIIGTMSRLTLVKHQTFLTMSACLNVLNQALEARDFKVKSKSGDSANCNECKIQAYSKKLKRACFKGDLALISSSFLGEVVVRGW